MLCPVCEVEMIVLELDEVEVDYCTSCKGVWLDPGELEMLVEMAGAGAGPLSQAVESGGRKIEGQKRRCPACRKKMLELDVEGPPRVVVDRCRYGHGLWLDDSELGQLIESVGGSPETEALARLCGRLLQSDRQSQPEGTQNDVGTDSGQ